MTWRALARLATRLLPLALGLMSQAPAAPPTFPLPASGRWGTWEAEQAASSGPWRPANDPAASAGRYLEAGRHAASLEFRFRTSEPTTLRVRPVWWRTSAMESAREFPYPLPGEFGPGPLDTLDGLVFFAAPAAGRVGWCDPETKRLTGSIAPGGYLTDLMADPQRGQVCVTDAQGDRVLFVQGTTGRWEHLDLPDGSQPWSLALIGDRLYVACRGTKLLTVVRLPDRRIEATIPLPARPISLEAAGRSPERLVVRFQQEAIHALTLQRLQPDQQQYGVGENRAVAALGRDKRYEADRAQQALRIVKGGATTMVDVRSVTAPEATPASTAAGPGAMALAGAKLFFAAPDTGRIGLLDTGKDALLPSIEVGGRPTDIVALPGGKTLYTADAVGRRLVVVDADGGTVAGEIPLPGVPVFVAVADNYTLQRSGMLPPTPIQRAFVCCANRQLVVVDLKTHREVGRVHFDFEPRAARLVPPPLADWWPMMADDRIPLSLVPRVAVEPMPMAIDPSTLAVVPAPDVREPRPQRTTAVVKVEGKDLAIAAAAPLLLKIGATDWLDASVVCDPQAQPQRPLRRGDVPGSLGVAVDDGPEMDWRRGIWTRPDNGLMLTYGTEEYWRWNAPALSVGAGEHVLRLIPHGQAVRLDGVQVMPTADLALDLQVLPEPREVHAAVPGPSYQGVFYDQEPVQFRLVVTNAERHARTVHLSGTLANYMGETSALPELPELALPAGGQAETELRLQPRDTGRFTLTVRAQSGPDRLVRDVCFVRLPRLEHPRLLFRPQDTPAIARRIAAHPRLFARYADWLERMSVKEGNYPERFLPNGLTAGELATLAPEGTQNPQNQYGWRMYELAWRMLAVQFAARYIPGADAAALDARLQPLLEAPKTDMWSQYHHHGPLFPGAVESMVDLAPGAVREQLPLMQFFARAKGNMDVYPFTLMSLKEPLTPTDRALVYEITTLHGNLERYFTSHSGTRGGTWWQNPWSWCYCPTQGLFLNFLFSKNVLGEERCFEKPFFRNYLTFMAYADPISDKAKLLPALRRPSGEPWRWVLTQIARHPVEKAEYDLDGWVRRMDGDLPEPEAAAVDDLMALKGHPMSGPFEAAPHRFNTAVAIPVALALGWYDPDAPTATWDEMPPTALFDVDGWAAMRSGFDAQATEVTFTCGVRDHTTRHQPNHFTVVQGGEFLVGTPSLWADDGNCVPAWGNTVVAGDGWLGRWQLNLHAPRSADRALIDRFSPANWAYLARDRALCGYAPAEGGWGGGIDLHGHTQTLMVDEGRLVAYETWPEFDYVAGEAAGAWPTAELRSHLRQVLFLKPDVVIIYDRALGGPAVRSTAWLAATRTDLSTEGQRFAVTAGSAHLTGRVLWPLDARLDALQPPPGGFQWKLLTPLRVRPATDSPQGEYLVVLTTGEAAQVDQCGLSADAAAMRVQMHAGGRQYEVTLNRAGPVGGTLGVLRDGQTVRQPLAQGIDDTYAHWQGDPRYEKWMREARFDFMLSPADRARK